MKRPPGIWFLLSAGVLWLSIHNVYGLKATEIIFKKTTSTTTTTTETPVSSEQSPEEVATEAGSEAANVTKSLLTGIPQIDYQYDPNLPRELNGYNLSSYPFYNSLPENITFKCDGLHDGFYASIPHKCQVYHHCISGTRYDFLCANYTAFDQTIFNCHFVSEVDCDNSQKFWHRNDALYIAATTTTTTIRPTPIVISPALTGAPRRPPPPLGRRRPTVRRRPAYDYYEDDEYTDDEHDDYYERPLPRRRRKRPRPRPRPIYDDEYEEYDDRYERRGSGRRDDERRREYDNEDKRSYEKSDERRDPNEKQERHNDGRRHVYDNDKDRHVYKKQNDRRSNENNQNRHKDDRPREYEEESRRLNAKPNSRRTTDPKYDRPHEYENKDETFNDRHMSEPREDSNNDKKNLYNDRRYDEEKRRDYEDGEGQDSYSNRRRQIEKRRPSYDRPHKPQRRPYNEDRDDNEKDDQTEPQAKVPKTNSNTDGLGLVKPQGPTSVYNQPRMPPRVKPPMPKTTVKTTTTTEKPVTIAKLIETEYYDDYEDEPSSTTSTTTAPKIETIQRQKLSSTVKSFLYEDEYSDETPTISSMPKKATEENKRETGTRLASPRETKPRANTFSTTYLASAITTSSTTTTEQPKERSEAIVRIVKRPFLPSRGGNPYLIRGLQPVGAKALDTTKYETEISDVPEKYETSQPQTQSGRQFPKTFHVSQPITKEQPQNKLATEKEQNKSKFINPTKFVSKIEEPFRNINSKIPERNPLDIDENEYDVTLNDALNPTIPNLPVRNFPTGFGTAPSDYFYNALRTRYDGYNVPSESFQPKSAKQRDETIVTQPQTYRNPVAYPNRNFRPNLQITQANAQGFFTPY